MHRKVLGLAAGLESMGRAVPNRARGAVPRCGLVGMFERVQLLGGQLTVTSEPGKGTTVEVVVRGVAAP